MNKAELSAIKYLESKGNLVLVFTKEEVRNAEYAGAFYSVRDHGISFINEMLASYDPEENPPGVVPGLSAPGEN